jgi:hypothetical protein
VSVGCRVKHLANERHDRAAARRKHLADGPRYFLLA